MLLLIDNYDSFTFNLRRYFRQLGQEVYVARNDSEELGGDLSQFAGIVISPGPKAPKDAGSSLDVVRNWSGRIPILGVCLGHQTIFEAFGGEIIRAKSPTHGKSSSMTLSSSRLFEGIPTGTHFARYHSLVGDSGKIPGWLRVIAWSNDKEVMAIEHIEHPTFGVQFHPESILSSAGHQLLKNFLICSAIPVVQDLPESDLVDPSEAEPKKLSTPQTDLPPVPLPVSSWNNAG